MCFHFKPERVTSDFLENLINGLFGNRCTYPLGLFYLYDDKVNQWIAVDNSGGSAYTEQFDTKQQALYWLMNGDISAEECINQLPRIRGS